MKLQMIASARRVYCRIHTLFASICSADGRYRHAQLLHSLRVGLAMLVTIVVTTGMHIPYGGWSSVSMLIVIGGLQHHGNIRNRAADRALGTLFGGLVGLGILIQHATFGSAVITYFLLALTAAVCGYYAIGRGGYIALLTAITVCIVAEHGDDSITMGMWRAVNVLIGITVALAFSFALPLYATYSWRNGFAKNMRYCAGICREILCGNTWGLDAQGKDALAKRFADVNKRMIGLRALMPSVAKEIDVPLACLEELQYHHRTMLSALEMMASVSAASETERGGRQHAQLQQDGTRVRATLLQMARALRTGSAAPMGSPYANLPAPEEVAFDSSLAGPQWVLQKLAIQIDAMHTILSAPGQKALFNNY